MPDMPDIKHIARLLKNSPAEAFEQLPVNDAQAIGKWAGDIVTGYGNILKSNQTHISDITLIEGPPLNATMDDIKVGLKIKIIDCIKKGRLEKADLLKTGYTQLGTFLEIHPEDREHINTVELHKHVANQLKFLPEHENDIVDEKTGLTLKQLLRQYTKALPVFNRYMEKVESETDKLSIEINSYLEDISKRNIT